MHIEYVHKKIAYNKCTSNTCLAYFIKPIYLIKRYILFFELRNNSP